MNNIFDDLVKKWHHDPANPAATTPQPAITTTPATGGHVKIADLTKAAHNSFTQGIGWLDAAAAKFPAVLAEIERLQASPIIQALEGVALTPAVEQAIAGMIAAAAAPAHNTMANEVAEPVAAAEPQPAQPAA